VPFSEELLTHKRRGVSNTGLQVQGWGLGDVSFVPSAGHASVTNYEARVRADGSGTVIATKALGVPTPQSGRITVNLRALLDSLSPGNYTVSIAATSAGGTDDSDPTSAFIVPLETP
jgi:hypothetical protein